MIPFSRVAYSFVLYFIVYWLLWHGTGTRYHFTSDTDQIFHDISVDNGNGNASGNDSQSNRNRVLTVEDFQISPNTVFTRCGDRGVWPEDLQVGVFKPLPAPLTGYIVGKHRAELFVDPLDKEERDEQADSTMRLQSQRGVACTLVFCQYRFEQSKELPSTQEIFRRILTYAANLKSF